jgi:hypothetical protein
MGDLLELLRRVDAAVIGAFTAAGTSDEDQPVWGAVLAVIGGLVVLAGAVAFQTNAHAQLAVVCGGLLLTVPYLQSRFDRARVAAED